MEAVREFFGNCMTSRFGHVAWLPRSPEVSVCEFCFVLWGYLEGKVYATLDELKRRIQDEIHSIPADTLQRSVRNLNGGFQERIRTGGLHPMDVIFKKW